MSVFFFFLHLKNLDLQFENESVKNVVKKLEENKKLKLEIMETKELYSQSSKAHALEMYNLHEELKDIRKEQFFSFFASLILEENSKLVLYTGIPNLKCFQWILSVCESFVQKEFKLPKDRQVLLVFIKIRMALCDDDLANRFNISRKTVRRLLDVCLPVLAARLKHLIFWPHKNVLKKKKITRMFPTFGV